MAPKKFTRGEKPKTEIIISTIEIKRELTTKWESGSLQNDHTEEQGSH
jgi:hypothetical protein